MLFSRFLLSAYLNNVSYKVGRTLMATETHFRRCSGDSKESSMSYVGGSEDDPKKALILRVFQDEKGNRELSQIGQDLDKKTSGKLTRFLKQLTNEFKLGEAFVVSDVDIYEAVALSCCGPKDAKVNDVEGLNEKMENVRCWVGAGYKALKLIRAVTEAEASSDVEAQQAQDEAFHLTKWTPDNSNIITAEVHEGLGTDGAGVAFGHAQNWARYLSQLPPNKMKPDSVVQEASTQLQKLGITVKSFEKKDIEAKKMSAFLAVAQGSSAPPVLLECDYVGKKDAPSVLIVAKGLTFDSGGLCLKKPEGMLTHDGMTGAAVALGAIMGVATLKVPINVKLVVPLCENMISGQCLKVGDVVPTLQGLDVKVEDTDLEGHLMLADALAYGQAQYKPKYVIDVASLTPGIAIATGGGCYGCFTNSDDLWNIARDAGVKSGDRPWRFPIWNYYGKQITGDTPLFKLQNRGSGLASHCIGAAFLQNFVSGDNWLHYDITGMGRVSHDAAPPYLDPNFMTGRPTRALIAAIMGLASKKEEGGDCSGMGTTSYWN